MTSATVPVQSETATDPRLSAFIAPNCPEVFHSVATPTAIWRTDPYDVETIHPEARAEFERLLHRGGRTPQPPSGAILVLLGEAGSGKTHLLRAFRTRAHSQGLGYCGYMQMTTETSSYARYMLTNLIDGLEQPYAPEGSSRTGLARLSRALLESLPGRANSDTEFLCEDGSNPTHVVDDYADRLHSTDQFRNCDLTLIQVMLHLERKEPQVRSRALMWLRCEEMRPQDREWIGGVAARTDDAHPMRMLQQLAQLTNAIDKVPLVLLIDQLEDMSNQSAPMERFLKVVDAITSFTDQIPNTVVVLACLEDYFKTNVDKLNKSKHDRLMRDPEPLRLLGNRTLEDIRYMTARRLAHLYDTAEVETNSTNELYPFRESHLTPLNGMRTRDALDFLRRHHQRCIAAGRWEEPDGVDPGPGPGPETGLDALWNDFHSSFSATVPDEENSLAQILASAIGAASDELPEGYHFACGEADQRYLEVETQLPDGAIDQLIVAVCNASVRGTSLGKQITELEKRCGEIPVAIVRTIDFPKTGKAMTQIAGMLKRHGRTAVVADADWRRMLAFREFRRHQADRPDFISWQKQSHPLGELESLQKILNLKQLVERQRATVAPVAPKPPDTPATPTPPVKILPIPPVVSRTEEETGSLTLGKTQSLTPTPVTFEVNEFTRHAAFLGGSGSGKTTAAMNLIEQLLARGIPAVLLDRKGDLCRYADPAAWESPLADPARSAARKLLKDKLNVATFTPGEASGRPLALPVVPPGFDQLSQADRERFAQYAAAALGSMIGFKTSDADKGQRAILAKAIETLAAVPGAEITLPTLRNVIENQDESLLSAIGGGYPDRFYENLAQRLLTLELNNRQLLTGNESLDIDLLLGTGRYAQPGRVQMSVISTRFLGDAAKVDFWVSQFLVAVSRWCAKSPQARLQAVFLFDEADRYLPATSKPATKEPMEDLLKRARSAGVGIFLATQSPGDLDYKCKENVMTWLIGRIKEPRAIEKLKPMLAAAKGDVTDKLAGQTAGQFYLIRETGVISIRSNESLIRTEQLPEDAIAKLACASLDSSSPAR